MTGVIYGGDYRGMADNPSHLLVPPADPADAYEYYATLSNNYNRTNAHMKIDVARVNETVYGVNIYMDYSTVSCHSDYVRMTGPIDELSLQSHWGSGVVFSNMSIIKK